MRKKPVTLELGYREPYDFAGVLEFLGRRSIPEVEAVDGGTTYRRALPDGGWIEVSAAAEGPAVVLRMFEVPVGLRASVAERTRAVFDLDAEPAPINRALRRGTLLRPSVRRRPGLRVAGSWDGFDLAVRAVLGQQISVAAARTLAARLVRRYGRPLDADAAHGITHAFPEPEVLAEAGFEGIGTTRNVAETLRTVARAVCDGSLSFDPSSRSRRSSSASPRSAASGPGPRTTWRCGRSSMPTRSRLRTSCCARSPARPGRRSSRRRWRRLAEAWRPYRSYAVMHLWRMAGDLAARR
jgi:AraC family transcriptional regulator of adaptative response / DNA-3-methyladenine glycosylase II